jgi:bifunctional DNA-binding transcriptional regulator/antitoxin component of YhaV-PrlF toxin-antitoxin module
VIPREMLETLNIREGDFVALQTHANGVLIKPQQVVDPDDVLSREESALIAKARREMRTGKYVTLAQLQKLSALSRQPSARRTREPRPVAGTGPRCVLRLNIAGS